MFRPLIALAAAVALVGAGSAAAATAPTASTGPVTAVGPTTATVSGSVNPNGTATTWHVEYGTSTSYGSNTSAVSAGSGTSSTAVSASLTGLQPGTSYHYRFVATSTAGTGRGADGLLTTSSAPVAVTGSASGIAATAATLNGTVNPSGRATTWHFEYGTSTSYGSSTATKDAGAGTSASSVSAPVTGLRSGRLYHFRLVATSDAGTSRGSDQTFTPSAAPTVTTKAASSVQDTSAKLNGSAVPNGQATTAYFEYGTSTSYGAKTAAANVGSGTSSANVSTSVSGLAAGTIYHFRLVATSAAGTTNGSDQSFTTTGPPAVKTTPATSVSSNAATLTGSVDPAGHSTTWYFQYGTSAGYGMRTPTQSAGSTPGAKTVSAAVASLSAGRTYHFQLVATNSAGTRTGADTTFTTAGPPITLATSSGTVVYRNVVMLRGTVSTGKADETVVVYAQRFASGSFTSVATVLTDAGGTWSLPVRPPIGTTYKAVWNGSPSSLVSVGVRPSVSLRSLPGRRFTTHVVAARSLAGRRVQLQRHLLDGRWVTVALARLNGHSTAVFHPKLPRGRSTLRVALSVNQAGGGYLAGFSRWVSLRRR